MWRHLFTGRACWFIVGLTKKEARALRFEEPHCANLVTKYSGLTKLFAFSSVYQRARKRKSGKKKLSDPVNDIERTAYENAVHLLAQYERRVEGLKLVVAGYEKAFAPTTNGRVLSTDDDDELGEQTSKRALTLNCLRNANKRMTARQVADDTGLTIKEVQYALKGLLRKKNSHVKKIGALHYRYDKPKETQAINLSLNAT